MAGEKGGTAAGESGGKPFQRILTFVDIAVLTILPTARENAELAIYLQPRRVDPFAGALSLPGGSIETSSDPTLEVAARRILADRTGIRDAYLEQVATVGDSRRDPRGWSVAIAYCALVRPATLTPAQREGFVPLSRAISLTLAFDHDRIATLAGRRVMQKSAYSTMPLRMIDAPFNRSEMVHAWFAVTGNRIAPGNLARKLIAAGAIEDTGERLPHGGRGVGPGGQAWRLPDDGIRTLDREL